MFHRFVFYSFCCFAVVSCFTGEIPTSARDREESIGINAFRNSHGSSNFGQGGSSLNGVGSFGQTSGGFGHNQHKPTLGSSHGEEENQFGSGVSSFNRPSEQGLAGSHSGSRPGSTGEGSHNRPSEQKQSGSSTTGGSSHNGGGSRPGGNGGGSYNRPSEQNHSGSTTTGGSSHNGEGSSHNQGGSRPGITGGSLFNRPSEQSPFGSGSTQGLGGSHSGSRPGNTGGSLFNRPSEQKQSGSSTTGGSGHNGGGSRPGGNGGGSYNRPSEEKQSESTTTGGSSHNGEGSSHNQGGSSHNQGGSRPGITGGSLFNRPLEQSPFGSGSTQGLGGSRPGNTGGSSFNRPSEQNQSGSSHGQGGSSHNQGGSSHNQGGSSHNQGGSSHNQGGSRPGIIGGTSSNRPSEGNQPGLTHNEGSNQSEHQQQNLNGNKKPEDDGKEDDKDVCFARLGCFRMGSPWKSAKRPVAPPQSPEKIRTRIYFFSRDDIEKQKNITLHPRFDLGGAKFDPNKITAMIIHGFVNSGNATWMRHMKNAYLKNVDANLMIVDWGEGAQLLNYFQVCGNTRVVGKQLGLFIKHLMDNFGADPGKFHLIGHSLGAQIASYVGKEVPGIARITALDPAQPAYEGFDKEVRLDKTDAEFVDVIHTDARPFIPTLGFGMMEPVGHVDFYMNGGFDQPGCLTPTGSDLPKIKSFFDLAKFPVETISKMVACPHARSYEFLIEAFNETEKCIFWGHKADPKNIIKAVSNTVTQGLFNKVTSLSTTCSKENCIPLGFATRKSPLRGSFVITTNRNEPYCISEPGVPAEESPEALQRTIIQKVGKRLGVE